jgi:hypothetical protein
MEPDAWEYNWATLSLSVCLSVYLSIYGSAALVDIGRLFRFLILSTVGRTPWTGAQPIARPLPIHRTTQTQKKRTQISIPRVGFELTIPVLEQAKAVHALDRAATVIGSTLSLGGINTDTLSPRLGVGRKADELSL